MPKRGRDNENDIEYVKIKQHKMNHIRLKSSLDEIFLSEDIAQHLTNNLASIAFHELSKRVEQVNNTYVELMFCRPPKIVFGASTKPFVPATQVMAEKMQLTFKINFLACMTNIFFKNFFNGAYSKTEYEKLRPFFDVTANLFFDFVGELYPHRYVQDDGKIYLCCLSEEEIGVLLTNFFYNHIGALSECKTLKDLKQHLHPHSCFINKHKDVFDIAYTRLAEPCPICMDKLSVKRSMHMSCQTVYCTSCFDSWKENSDTCPMCRDPKPYVVVVDDFDSTENQHVLSPKFLSLVTDIAHIFKNIVIYELCGLLFTKYSLTHSKLLHTVTSLDQVSRTKTGAFFDAISDCLFDIGGTRFCDYVYKSEYLLIAKPRVFSIALNNITLLI